MKKKLSLLMVALVAIAAFAGLRRSSGDKVIYSWPKDGVAANKVTLAEGVTVEINGNTGKNVSAGSVVTVNETGYTTMKVSNGAQNTLTLQKKAVAVTFYSYVNKNASETTKESYWKEVNGVSYTAETSGGKMTQFKDIEGAFANPDVRRFEFETPTNVITFNNAGDQLCYIVEVEYEAAEEQGGGGEPSAKEETIAFTAAGEGTNPMVYSTDHFTFSFDKKTGSTSPAYNGTSAETRLYAKGALTIAGKANEKITKVVFDYTVNANKNGVTPTIDGVAGTTNAGKWDAENKTWTGEDTEVTLSTSGTAGNVGFKSITVTYEEAVAPAVEKPKFSVDGGEYIEAQSVELTCDTEGAEIFYALNDATEYTKYTAAISVTETTTIKAYAQKGVDKSAETTATYTIVTPLTVAEVIAAIDGGTAGNCYVQGIVSKVDSYNEKYKSITYLISADGSEEGQQFKIYSGKGLNGADITSVDDVKVGAKVVVYGSAKKYNEEYELDKNNMLVKYEAPKLPEGTIWKGEQIVTLSEGWGWMAVEEPFTTGGATIAAGQIITIKAHEPEAATSRRALRALAADDIIIKIKPTAESEWSNADVTVKVIEEGYQFAVDADQAAAITARGFAISNNKEIVVTEINVADAPVAKDIVYDFAAEQALIAAGTVEKPGNVGGNQSSGQGFNAYSVKIRNDYKGYAKKEGSTLPETCNIWRRVDRFDQDASWNTAGGVLMPNDREFAIDGLTPGSKVIIEYDATNATNKDIIWAVGENNKLGEAVGAGEGIPVTTATIGGVEAVPGQTAIASGAEILVKSVTPAVKGTGYIVLQVKKNMVISKITIIPNEDAVNYDVNVSETIENGTVKVNRTTAYEGDDVYVTATPAEGYVLDAISVRGVTSDLLVEVTDGKFIMPDDAVTVSATFKSGYKITAVNAEGITITPEVAYAAEGEKVYATYTLAEGYQLDKPEFVDDNGDAIPFAEGQVGLEKVGDVEKMFIIMPATNVTIKAKASKIYQITLDLSQENGNATCLSVNKEKPETAFKKEGAKIYLAINPDAGYEAVISVKAGEDDVEVTAEAGTYDEQQYTHFFTMPASAVTVTVTFKSTVGINSIAADKIKDATIYTVGGQRVNSAKKGLYIINGKKVVIK